MAYRFDQYDQSLIIDGFEAGIGTSPHTGLADMRNVNIVSIPGEASVGFSTSAITAGTIAVGTVTAVDAVTDTITFSGASGLENGMAVYFSGTVPGGVTVGSNPPQTVSAIYWIKGLSGSTFKLSSAYDLSTTLNITDNTAGATFNVYSVNQPKYFTYDSINAKYYMIDSVGLVWSNAFVTGTNSYWVYMGNLVSNYAHGNGIAYYQWGAGAGYIFAFSNSSIDLFTVNGTWTYNWDPIAGTFAGFSTTPTAKLKMSTGAAAGSNSHEALLAPDSRVYFCDANWIDRFYVLDPTGQFNPADTTTYVWDQTSLLPQSDNAQCLAFLGTNLLVGGKNNIIYPWDRFDTNFNFPILLPEFNVQKMVTVNTNTYIFVGNRGRIYYTNGSNVNLYKKVPDHISGTVEPYFTWGGATSVKNQLYFGVSATTNAGVAVNQYGGLWAIDLDTQAIRLTNKLSYATYAGYPTALIPNFATTPAGTGMFIGWDSGASTYGVDQTSSTPYSNSEATIDSDLIPIGTYQKPRDFTKIEYRLTRPLVSGESITIKTRLVFNTTDTGYTTTLTDNTAGNYSNIGDVNFKNAQWVQFQIVLSSTASSPSYVRVKEIRVLGLLGPTLASSQQLGL